MCIKTSLVYKLILFVERRLDILFSRAGKQKQKTRWKKFVFLHRKTKTKKTAPTTPCPLATHSPPP